jgi:two-component sensor histidine kinase/tetratricopeptide (TPR) repeat protein
MRIFLFIILFITLTSARANQDIDSVRIVFNTGSDSLRFKAAIKLAINHEGTNTDSTNFYYSQAIKIAKENQWSRYVANSYFNQGFYYHYSLGSDTSIQFLESAMDWYIKANDSSGVLNCYYTLGTFWGNFDQLDSSIFYLEEAIEYSNNLTDSLYRPKIFNNLGLMYQYIGQYDLALKNFIKAAELKEKYKSESPLGAYLNIGLTYLTSDNSTDAIKYFNKARALAVQENNKAMEALSIKNTGDVFKREGNMDSADYYYNKALPIFIALNDSNSIARYHLSRGEMFSLKLLNDSAQVCFDKALKTFPEKGSQRLLTFILNSSAQSQFLTLESNNTKGIQEVIKRATKALQISEEIGLLSGSAKASKILFEAYSLVPSFKMANAYATKYMTLNDSLINEQKIESLAEQQTKFETEKKELEIELLNTENELKTNEILRNEDLSTKQKLTIYLLLGGVLGIAIIAIVTFKYYKKQESNNIKLAEKNLLISTQKEEKEVLLKEIHHRVKNNLQIIWSLLDLQSHSITDEQVKLAINDGKNRVNSMAMIHQMLYQNEDAGNIYFKDYIHKLTHQIRSSFSGSEKVKIELNIPDTLKFDIDTSIPLGLMITELFTNSLKYGVVSVSKPLISLKLTPFKNDEYLLTISDNGPGMPVDFSIKKSNSLGLKLVTNLSKQLQGKLSYQLNNGAEFNITFKGKSFTIA